MCYGLGSWCLSTWKVSLVMLRAVETFWEIFRICKTPGFLQHSWRLSIGDSYKTGPYSVPDVARKVHLFMQDTGDVYGLAGHRVNHKMMLDVKSKMPF